MPPYRIITSILLALSASMMSAADTLIDPKGVKITSPDSITPVRTTEFKDTNFDDLKAFGAAVGNARYVILGEKTHGEGNVFALKTRLVRYLHEELGFEVLAIESGLYEGAKINSLRESGKPLRELVPGNIFFMYSTTTEVAPLFDYLDTSRNSKKPLALTTFDSQHSGKMSRDSMLVDLANYLTRNNSDIPRTIAWRGFAAQVNMLLQFSRTAPPADEQKRFFDLLDRIDQTLKKGSDQSTQFPNGASFWIQVSTSIRSQANAFWQPETIPGYNAPRELAMASNLYWVLEKQHPGKKVVIWAHDFHGQKAPLFPGMKGMLNMVREIIPAEKFYHVYFTGHSGRFFDFISGKIVDIPTPPSASIEAQLHAAGHKQVFIDLTGQTPEAKAFSALGISDYNTYFGNTGYFSQGKPTLGDYTDGVFYLDTITAATRVTDNK